MIGLNLMPSMLRSQKIEIIENLQGLIGLRSEWNELASPTKVEPWQSFSWNESAAMAYSKNQLLRIITVRKGGKLTSIAPLVLKQSDQVLKPWQLHFIGGEELKEPNRLISADPNSLDFMMDVIASERVYPIRLSRVTNERGTLKYLLSKFKKKGWITSTMHMPYPYLNLVGNPIKKSLKEDLRRARKKAKKYGEVRIKVVSGIKEDKLLEHLERGFRIEASGWKGRNRTAILSNESRREFFERYAHSALREGALRLFFLLIDKEAVAVQYGIEAMNAFWLFNIGYDEKYRECSPGNLLLAESIKAASKNGLARYNLLGKDEPWTRRWTATTQDCLVLAAYRPNLCGIKAMVSDAFYLIQKRIRDRKGSS